MVSTCRRASAQVTSSREWLSHFRFCFPVRGRLPIRVSRLPIEHADARKTLREPRGWRSLGSLDALRRVGLAMWRSLSGKPVKDIVQAVQSVLHRDEHVVHVGTDSQEYGYHTNFVIVVAVIDPGFGGRVFYRRERTPRTRSLAHKLFKEAELSLAAALHLNGDIAHDIVVHVDANEDERHRSSKYVRALAGMVMGHGFQVRVKPDSWCATNVADHLVKGKHPDAA
jgi:predicted RNase H-related nuclease YkuK (DUF458 family)